MNKWEIKFIKFYISKENQVAIRFEKTERFSTLKIERQIIVLSLTLKNQPTAIREICIKGMS